MSTLSSRPEILAARVAIEGTTSKDDRSFYRLPDWIIGMYSGMTHSWEKQMKPLNSRSRAFLQLDFPKLSISVVQEAGPSQGYFGLSGLDA